VLSAESILPLGAVLSGHAAVPSLSADEIDEPFCVLETATASYVIRYGHIEPGSVLLTRPAFDAGSKLIAGFQSFIFDDEIHSMWSHVAIMGAGQMIWDIMPDLNVRNLSMKDFLQNADFLAVRRLRKPGFDEAVLQAHIEDQRHAAYPSLQDIRVVNQFLKMMAKGQVVPLSLRPTEFVCSTFVDRILRMASNSEILPEDRPALALPGHFARSTAFEDVVMNDRMAILV
jgi:hypothetical protein